MAILDRTRNENSPKEREKTDGGERPERERRREKETERALLDSLVIKSKSFLPAKSNKKKVKKKKREEQ